MKVNYIMRHSLSLSHLKQPKQSTPLTEPKATGALQNPNVLEVIQNDHKKGLKSPAPTNSNATLLLADCNDMLNPCLFSITHGSTIIMSLADRCTFPKKEKTDDFLYQLLDQFSFILSSSVMEITCSADQTRCLPQRLLENIEEDETPSGLIVASSLPPPETPTETMEFLARSWSLSATDLSKALGNILPPALPQNINVENHKFLRGGPRARTMGGWMRDHKERRRAEARTRAAQIYAATSVAGVASVVAATAAGSVFSPDLSLTTVASAAALVASHCVEMAQAIGASREQIFAVIRSAVNAQTAGDIMALTAGAATALRAAALLTARQHKEIGVAALRGGDNRDPEVCSSSAQSFVSRGGELLKRTRKGDLHWKQVCVYINSNWQVVLKMKSTHMAGSFMKKKKGAVVELCPDIPAWPGRKMEDGCSSKAYFGIRTHERLIEFQCKTKCEKKIWVDGIQQILKFRANHVNVMRL